MAEVFTISGADDYGSELGASDVECAQQVKVPLLIGAAGRLGGVGVGLYGVYRVIKPSGSGSDRSRAGGIVGLVAAGALWFLGGRMMQFAVKQYAGCTGQPLKPAPFNPFGPAAP